MSGKSGEFSIIVRGTAEGMRRMADRAEAPGGTALPEALKALPERLRRRAGRTSHPEEAAALALEASDKTAENTLEALDSLKKAVPEARITVAARIRDTESAVWGFFAYDAPEGQAGLFGEEKDAFAACFARNGRPRAALTLTDSRGEPRRLEYLVENETLLGWTDPHDPAAWWQAKKGRAVFCLYPEGRLRQLWNPALGGSNDLLERTIALEKPFHGDYSPEGMWHPKALEFAKGLIGMFIPTLQVAYRGDIPCFLDGKGDEEYFFGGMLHCEGLRAEPDWAFPEEAAWADFPALLEACGR